MRYVTSDVIGAKSVKPGLEPAHFNRNPRGSAGIRGGLWPDAPTWKITRKVRTKLRTFVFTLTLLSPNCAHGSWNDIEFDGPRLLRSVTWTKPLSSPSIESGKRRVLRLPGALPVENQVSNSDLTSKVIV